MITLGLTNIFNDGKIIYLFHRVGNELKIMTDRTYFPYFYQPDSSGIFRGYRGERLKKINCQEPYQIMRQRDALSMESDVIYVKRYLIDKINPTKCQLRWVFFDIEVVAPEFPNPEYAQYPVCCITTYDNYTDEYKTFWLPDYKTEFLMLDAFCEYINSIKPDILLGWNAINFDFPYLRNRSPDFSKRISPVKKEVYYNKFPAGISIVDYMTWDKKTTLNRKRSYALEARSIEELGSPANPKMDFTVLSEQLKQKNIEDVKKMVMMEQKFHYINLYDDIRIMSKCLFEDIEFNSHIIDQLVLQEAKQKGLVLPSKQYDFEPVQVQAEKDKFEGAFREAFHIGRFEQIGKYDLSGAYLFVITDLCLDSANIRPTKQADTLEIKLSDRVSKEIKEIYHMKQSYDTILPSLARRLIADKVKYKDLKKNTDPQSPQYKEVESKYEAVKTIFLSAWGVIGNKGFRLFDPRIAGMITSCIRDLVQYVNNELQKEGYRVIYIDTDSCFVDDKGKDISELLNQLIQKWSQSRFGKKSSILFEYEGHFTNLFIIAKCHYVGNLVTKSGNRKETKGIEAKRKDSTPFMAKFQTELIDMVLAGESEETCRKYMNEKLIEIESAKLIDIAPPCRIATDKVYKNVPIFMRALGYTKELVPGFAKKPGDMFYYIYVKPFGVEQKKAIRTVKGEKKEVIVKKNKDVLAFDEERFEHIKDIDWERMKDRNILKKANTIFAALNGEITEDEESDAV